MPLSASVGRFGRAVVASSRPVQSSIVRARFSAATGHRFPTQTAVFQSRTVLLLARHYSAQTTPSSSSRISPSPAASSQSDAGQSKPAKAVQDQSVANELSEKLESTSAETPVSLTEAGRKKGDATAVAAAGGEKKSTLWQKVKKEVAHYRDGTKLLAMEVKISSRLALKMAAGYELTRREHRQLQRTVRDLGRLVPFSVFVIVPFAELLLPVALKLFPNMLPSTYEGKKDREKKAASLRATRSEVSNFLRHTLQESGLPVTAANAKKEEFTDFFRKVRTTGESPTQADVIKVCKIFKDDITLDNLSRPQLVAITRYMNLNHVGPDTLLRYQIRHRMRQIKRDDRAIAYEGVDSLSVPEVQMACAHRGLPTLGLSPARLRDDIQLWLDLRLKFGVPSTLLVLSNAFMYGKDKESGEIGTQIDALQTVLSSIPEELFHEIELEVHNAEGAATNKQRLEVIKEQQDLIEEENAQHGQDEGKPTTATVSDKENIDDDQPSSRGDKQPTGSDTTTTVDSKEGEKTKTG